MTTKEMKGCIAEVQDFFNRSTRALEESDSGFKPAAEMFTAAEQMAHAAQTVEWFYKGAFAPGGFDMDFERLDREVRAVKSIAGARAWMARACEEATEAIESHTEAEWAAPLPEGAIFGGRPRYVVFSGITDHTAHHRGALTVYARLRGKVPPMPYMDM